MQNFDIYDDMVEGHAKRISQKTKLNKYKYCKKNKISGKNYGPHTYDPTGKFCVRCGHLKKENKNNEREQFN